MLLWLARSFSLSLDARTDCLVGWVLAADFFLATGSATRGIRGDGRCHDNNKRVPYLRHGRVICFGANNELCNRRYHERFV